MKTVYSGPPEMAALLRGALRSRGIWAEAATTRTGTRHTGASVFVNDEDEAAAQSFVVEFQAPPLAEGSTWTWRCPSCGEIVEEQFGACWNCGARRDGS